MDFELEIFSKKKNLFKKNNIQIVVSDFDFIANCLDKKKFHEFCNDNKISTPKIITNISSKNIKYPIFVKERKGSGSINQYKIHSKNELKIDDNKILQEFIEGKEYGMDILNSYKGEYIHSFVRKKILMKNGETDQAAGIYSNKFNKIAKYISKKTKHNGNLDIDFIISKKDKKIYFLDFNPRFGGGYPITHLSGYNYLKYIIYSHINPNYQFKIPKKINKILMSKGISIYTKKL
jgi:carbamoyl-phosphate synthase large subunit